jgi:AraC-like DNA-binding protein
VSIDKTRRSTSYQALLDDVRHSTALRLLASTDLDVSELAFLLGFVELNSFSRTFHAWQGMTPLRWRDQAQRRPAARARRARL